ncbi:MAG: ABC transporter substrate-binding protein [Cyanobacteria bacterium P01_C01_bin.89]
MTRFNRYLAWLGLGILTAALIVACDRAPNLSEGDRVASGAAEPCRVIEHVMGKTEICGQPQKIAILSPRFLDLMLTLGVQPAALTQTVGNSGFGIFDAPTDQIPYLGKRLTSTPIELGTRSEPSLERLKSLQPDLILGEQWQTAGYDLMSQIAPTLLFDDVEEGNGFRYWQNDIAEIARALGREEDVEKLRVKYAEQIAQARDTLKPVLEAYPRVFLVTSNVEMDRIKSGNQTSLARLLEEIGFEIVQPPGGENQTVPLSWEIIPSIKSDLMVVASWDGDLTLNPEDSLPQASMRKRWAQNPLLKALPVSEQGRVVFVDYYISGGPMRGPLTDQILLESLPDLLLPTLAGALEVQPGA